MKWLFNFLSKLFPFLKNKRSTKNTTERKIVPGQNAVTASAIPQETGSIKIKMDPVLPDRAISQKIGIKNEAPIEPGVSETIKTQEVEGEKPIRRIEVFSRPFKVSVTGGINESLFSDKKRVGYLPNQKYHQERPTHFPYVLMPKYGTVIKPPVNGKTANKGMTEESFCRDYLMKYFNGKVFDNLTVFHGYSPMEPDISFIDLSSGKNIFIDIEIDEPYDGIKREPTHYLLGNLNEKSDMQRNIGFTDRGWMVIRFAEEQIIQNPGGCCRFIGEVINSIHSDFQITNLLKEEPLKNLKIWTWQEAEEMAKNKTREKYLGVYQFFSSYQTRDFSIQDSTLGKEIEKDLTATNAPKAQPTVIKPTVYPETPPRQERKVNPPSIIASTSSPSVKKEEPRVTKKEEGPSQPAPRTYGREKKSY